MGEIDTRAILARMDQQLDDLRHVSYQDVRCLVLNPATVRRLFGTKYDAETWCSARELVLMESTVIREGESFFGNRQTLDGGDDAIREMQRDIERQQQESAEIRREREARSRRRLRQ